MRKLSINQLLAFRFQHSVGNEEHIIRSKRKIHEHVISFSRVIDVKNTRLRTSVPRPQNGGDQLFHTNDDMFLATTELFL
jgi:hypothetical protein